MKRLYKVRNTQTRRDLSDENQTLYFQDKTAAKAVRKMANGVDEQGQERLNRGWTVSKGPDHKKAR